MDNSMLLLVCLVLVFRVHRLCCDKLVMYTPLVKFLESATMFFNKPHTIFKLLLIPSLNIFLLDSAS